MQTINSTFDWRGQPSEIFAANKSWLAKSTQVDRRTSTGTIAGLSKKADLRDNTCSNFCTPIPGPSDAAAQFRIKSSPGARA